MDATNKFTGKAALYAQHRPSYPEACFTYLIEANALTTESTAADIGAGTGIFTRALLDRGLRVIAVEPNVDMRETAEVALSGYTGYASLSGTAEQTGIADGSIDLVTVAQAFHWFDVKAFKQECRRILKPGGRVALIWNSRVHASEVVAENAAICREFCPAFNGFSGGMEERPERICEFFKDGVYEHQVFENPLQFDLDGFIGRNLSASYALKEDDAAYYDFIDALKALFAKYSSDGRLAMPNETRVYLGEV